MRCNVGDLGEDTFQRWCTAAGLNSHRAQRDKYGWDYLVEMEVPRNTGSVHDIHKPNGSFKVQVKSTLGASSFSQIELSNLLALATDPLPAFYLFLQFDLSMGVDPISAHLICLDNAWVQKILKRVREVTAQAPNVKLNKKKLRVNYGECDVISPCSANGFLQKVLELVSADFSAFARDKQDYLSTVGFEEGAAELIIQLETIEQQEKFILGTLGYSLPVSISSFKAWEKRFGIKDSLPFIDSTQGTIELIVRGQRSVRVMLTGLGMDPLFFDMKLYVSPIPAVDNKLPFRLQGEYFDILIDVSKQSLKVTPEVKPDQPYSAKEFQAAISLLNYLFTSKAKIDLAIEHDGDFLSMFSLNCVEVDKPFPWEEETLTNLCMVLAASGADPQVKITHRWLYDNRSSVNNVTQLIKGGVVLRSKCNNAVSLTKFATIKCVFALEIPFADQCLILFFSAEGELTSAGNSTVFLSNSVKLDRGVSGPRSDTWYKIMVNNQRAIYMDLDDDVLILDHLPQESE